jgi:hypothetical protein
MRPDTTKATLLILTLLTCASVGTAQITDYREEPVTGGEVWRVGGRNVQVRGTVITEGELFTVHAFVDHAPAPEDDRPLAALIARYGVERGYLENARKYNRYSEEYRVLAEVVGVVLIHVEDETTGAYSASSFAFPIGELYGEGSPRVESIRPPRSFDPAARARLHARLVAITEGGAYDRLVDLISERAGDLYDVEEAKRNMISAWLYMREVSLAEEGILIYGGSLAGHRVFKYYIPAEIVPLADESLTLEEYVAVLLFETAEGFDIYGIDLSFTTSEAADLYFGAETDES